MSLAISIGGVDYSGVLQYTGRSESLRRVQGLNGGTAMDGSDIYDDLALKYDLAVSTYPMKPAALSGLVAVLSASSISVTYYSTLRNTTVTQTMRCENIASVVGALKEAGTEAILQNVHIQLRQK